MAELLALIEPELYFPFIIVEKKHPVLYARVKKALNCMLQSALRFWEQALADLTSLKFGVNPYDCCAADWP